MVMLQNVRENCLRILEVEKHHQLRILIDKPNREKPKTVRTPDNIAAVAESVCEVPLTLIRRRYQQSHISETSLRRISHKDLGMTQYKHQLVKELKPIDHLKRFRFTKWACN